MDDAKQTIEIINQVSLVLREAQDTYGPAHVMSALVYVTGKIVAHLEQTSPGSGALWREHFEEVYKTEMERA